MFENKFVVNQTLRGLWAWRNRNMSLYLNKYIYLKKEGNELKLCKQYVQTTHLCIRWHIQYKRKAHSRPSKWNIEHTNHWTGMQLCQSISTYTIVDELNVQSILKILHSEVFHKHCTCMVSSLKGTTDIHAHINCTLYLSDVNLLLYFIVPSGLLGAPYDFSVAMSNTSNTTFLLSWGAPFSLDVTDSPDIFYYTLCTNITIYGCKNIPNDPDCTFPRTCMSSVDFTDPSLNGTNRGRNKTMMDYGDPIHFTFFAVNGAGSGENNTYRFIPQKQGLF